MPKGVRYMGENKEYFLKGGLPLDGKFILNKSVPGCGGTSMFLDSDLPIVLISPRIRVLIDKHEQYEKTGNRTFLFHTDYTSKSKRDKEICNMMSALNTYVKSQLSNLHPPKILVTLDSAKKVIDVLNGMRVTDDFLFVVDEFQCLIGDANYKGSTDMNFLSEIDTMISRICYLSATPIPDQYLDMIPQFQNIDYFKLEWDPSVLEDSTLKEVKMKKGETIDTICQKIISDFREKGYFARKVWNGQVMEAKEVCIFLNEVRKIKDIILKNNLSPSEVTILCSAGKSSELPKGFAVGGLSTDKVNPKNKTFTFCTKASFEGVDFYSNNAITYIFIDGNKPWQTLDIYLDIPQILGRQRLDSNPFKRDAVIYYKTKPDVEDENEFRLKQQQMELKTKNYINLFNSLDETGKGLFIDKIRTIPESSKYKDDYVDVISNGTNVIIGENMLVKAARWNDWLLRQHFYNHPCQLISGIQNVVPTLRKPNEVRSFEQAFYTSNTSCKLYVYSEFRYQYPQFDRWVYENPFIDCEYHDWYKKLGYQIISSLKFDEERIKNEYSLNCNRDAIIAECRKHFLSGQTYTRQCVKKMLQSIYDSLGLLGKKAKAKDLVEYVDVKELWHTNSDGKRNIVYLIL